MAQGQFLASTWIITNTVIINGTSMAAPVYPVVSHCLLNYTAILTVTQSEKWIMKALLCNGGFDRGNAGTGLHVWFGTMDCYVLLND